MANTLISPKDFVAAVKQALDAAALELPKDERSALYAAAVETIQTMNGFPPESRNG